jgi:tellurite resistance protein TehA-like permease
MAALGPVRGPRIRAAILELYPGYFAFVMATGILSTTAGVLDVEGVARALFGVNLVAYPLLWGLTLARLRWAPRRVLRELTGHATGPAYFTTVAATCLVGGQIAILTPAYPVAIALWGLAWVLWVGLMYTFMAAVTLREPKPPLVLGLNGTWLLLVVATEALSVLGSILATYFPPEPRTVLFAALCTFLLGCMLYVLIIALIFYRWTFLRMTPAGLAPPYWINMGALAITTLAGSRLVMLAPQWEFLAALRPFVAGLTLLFWVFGTWWIPLLLIVGLWRHGVRRVPLTYDPQYWGMIFPLGMYAAGTLLLAEATRLAVLHLLATIFAGVALLCWSAAFIALVVRLMRTLRAGRGGG